MEAERSHDGESADRLPRADGSSGESLPSEPSRRQQSVHEARRRSLSLGDGADPKHLPLLDVLPDAYIKADCSGQVVVTNPPLRRWVGLAEEQVQGMHLSELFSTDLGEPIDSWDILDLRGPARQHWTLRCGDGEFKPVEVTLVPLAEGDEEIMLLIREAGGSSPSAKLVRQCYTQLEQVFARVPDLVAVADAEGTLSFVQSQAEWSRMPEVVGSIWWSHLEMEYHALARHCVRQALASRDIQTAEVLDRDGLWWLCRHIPLCGEAKSEVLIVAENITERKAAEQTASECAARMLSLLENLPDDVLVLDRQGRVLYINRLPPGGRAEEILGSRHVQAIAEEDRDAYEKACAECFENGGTHQIEVRSASGRWWECRLVSLADYGEDRRLLVMVRDSTQQKLADEALRDRERRYRMLLHAVTSYTYTQRLSDGRVTSIEHGPGCRATTGYGPEDFLADPDLWMRIIHDEDRPRVKEFCDRVLAGEHEPPLEYRILHRDGGLRWVRHTAVVHRDAGEIVRCDAVIEEISERKAAEAALQAREAALIAAQKIQSRLLPRAPQWLADCDVAGASRPADFTGGDYFDYLSLPDGSTGFVVGDVTGHGLGPALLMALIHAHIRSLASTVSDLTEIVRRTNTFLLEEDEGDMFVTLFVGALEQESGWFRFVNAGHPGGYVLDHRGRVKAELSSGSLPLGVLADGEFCYGKPVRLIRGDLVLLLTDGIPEAESPTGELFGLDRTLECVRAHRALSAKDIIARLYDTVQQFSEGEKLLDDMTSIVIKIR